VRKLPLAKKKSSRTFLQHYKIAKKRNFKGKSLSAFYLRYHSVEEFDLLHAEHDDDETRYAVMETVEDVVMGTEEVGYEEVYDEEDDNEDEIEAQKEQGQQVDQDRCSITSHRIAQ
jgi:hypothetical protein